MELDKICRQWIAVLGLFAILLVVGIRIVSIFNNVPSSFVDEVILIEPAVEVAKGGGASLPALDQQLSAKGVEGLKQTYHITTQLNWLLRVPFICLGTNLITGKAIADLAITLIFTFAFVFAAKSKGAWYSVIFSLGLLLLYKYTGFSAAGRPDLLCASFGLGALGVTFRTTKSPPFQAPFLSGILIGLSFLTHQFGGIIWGLASAGILSLTLWPKGKQSLFAGWISFCLGGSIIGGIYLLTILPDYNNWQSQFFWLVELKKRLSINPKLSTVEVAKNLFLRNPLPLILMLVILPFTRTSKNLAIILALLAVLALSLIWRITGFEHYNPHYNAHFWTLMCLVIAFGLPSLYEGWACTGHRKLVLTVALGLTLFSGVLGNLNRFCSSLFLPHSLAFQQRKSQLSHIPDDGRVLVTSDLYFEVPSRKKVLMAHHEKMDLRTFDYIITSAAEPVVNQQRDQWFDALTPAQGEAFKKQYSLISSFEPNQLGWKVPLTPVQPTTLGCYIFQRIR